MQKYIPGAENVPLRHVNTSQPALIIVYDLLNDDNVVIEQRVDFASFEDRKWLGRITHWALSNHHSVETMALCDAEPPMENK